jgi:hypothetical protein
LQIPVAYGIPQGSAGKVADPYDRLHLCHARSVLQITLAYCITLGAAREG